jgi:hypothetical protein
VTIGVLCGVARWGWVAAFAFVVIAFSAGSVAACFLDDEGLAATPKVLRIAVWTGLTVTAVSGLVVVLRFAGVCLLLVVAAFSPFVRFCATRWFTTVESPGSPAPIPDATLPPALGELDDAALCLAWRRSFAALEAARSPSGLLAVVTQRQLYLDELHRRHPDGVASWLASGARAASNPMRFLGG